MMLHMDGLDANFCLIVLDYDFHDARNTRKKKIMVQDNKTIIGLSKKQSLYSLQLNIRHVIFWSLEFQMQYAIEL